MAKKSILIFGGLGTSSNYFDPILEVFSDYNVKVVDLHKLELYDMYDYQYDIIIGFSSSCSLVSHMYYVNGNKNKQKVILIDPPCCKKIRNHSIFKSCCAPFLFSLTNNLIFRRAFLLFYRYFSCGTTPYSVDDQILSMKLFDVRDFLKRFVIDYESFEKSYDMLILTNYENRVDYGDDFSECGKNIVKLNTCHHFLHWKPQLMKSLIDSLL